MKKIIIPIIAAVFTLSACNSAQRPESFETGEQGAAPAVTQSRAPKATATARTSLTQDEENAEPVEKKQASSAKPGWEIVREYSYDMNGDGMEDVISLYTSAMREEGEFMWDDTHSWCLEVKTDDGYYPLYLTDASRSIIYFSVGEQYGQTQKPVVYLYDTSGAGLALTQFTFEGDGFVRRPLYDSQEAVKDGINLMYSSVPEYRG